MDARRLTVLQILPALNSGGVERGVMEVAAALVAAGHRSLVVSSGGQLTRQLEDGGSQHFQLPIAAKSPLSLRSVAALRSLMIREGVDVVDIHSRLPGWLAWMAWKSLPPSRRPRFVSTLHGLHSVSSYSGIMCRGECVIAVSRTVREYIRQHYPRVDAARVKTIHRGVDAAEYPRDYDPPASWRQQFYQQYPRLQHQPVVTLAGRITRSKGHVDLLQMLHILKTRNVAVHGLIVGEAHPSKTGCLRQLRRMIRDFDLTTDVTFTGHRSDLKEIYAVSRLVVQLSRKPESFGRSAAESLAMGVPVLGYDHGGVGEILAAQFPQGRVPAGDVTFLAQRAEELLQTDGRPSVGANVFCRREMLAQTLEVYQSMVRERPCRRAA